ncbi:MAG: putative phage serine protease XkdF [Acidimicrobiaceae bacterium]|nr:putative phage serine protease XkdF [Acidimicrobiaceae bacterium]
MTKAIRKVEVSVCKVDKKLGLVFGYALICATKNAAGEFEPYYDQGSVDEDDGEMYADHISEDEMIVAVTDFMQSARIAKEMHDGSERGAVVHSFPLTEDIAKALSIDAQMTGWLVAMKPDPDMLAKFERGELTGFSIGGGGVRSKETTT